VLGPSGSGKSTIARAIAGLVPHSLPGTWHGQLLVGAMEVHTTPPRALAEHVGMVFQDPDSQLVMPRVADEVAFGLENRGWPLELMRQRVPDALQLVGLAGFEGRATAALSGGEQQRLAIAGVLAYEPGLLVLDEPTANLDPPGMEALFGLLGRVAAARDHTMVIVEHRLESVLPIADAVLLLDGLGRQLAFGAPDVIGPAHAAALHRSGAWIPQSWRGWAEGSGASGPRRRPPRPMTGEIGPEPVLEAQGLTVSYPLERAKGRRVVLKGIDLELRGGTRTALVGPNGAGKSSMLYALAGLRPPDGGWVRLGDGNEPPWQDPTRLRGERLSQLIALVFQDPEIGFVGRTVRDEVPGRRYRGAQAKTLAPEIDSILQRFGLAELAGRDPFRLSQGEQRRLSLAAASWGAPGVLLLDEPTYGLDRRGTDAVISLLDELRAIGQAQLLATHDPRLLPACDRVIALVTGKVAFDGPVGAFLEAPPFWPAEPWRRVG
jgi:energy-coupling factor transporter ATP-binding protein EcfA2